MKVLLVIVIWSFPVPLPIPLGQPEMVTQGEEWIQPEFLLDGSPNLLYTGPRRPDLVAGRDFLEPDSREGIILPPNESLGAIEPESRTGTVIYPE